MINRHGYAVLSRGGPYTRLRLNMAIKATQGMEVGRLISTGKSFSEAAAILGLSKTTAWRRYWWGLDWPLADYYGKPRRPVPPQRSTRPCRAAGRICRRSTDGAMTNDLMDRLGCAGPIGRPRDRHPVAHRDGGFTVGPWKVPILPRSVEDAKTATHRLEGNQAMGTNPLYLPPVKAKAGYYAVDDPSTVGRLTAWRVDNAGQLHRYGPERWEPLPPTFHEIADRGERSEARDRWYVDVYRPWKVAVVGAINADPAAAAEEFADAYPTAVADEQAARQARASRRRSQDSERKQRMKLSEDLLTALLIARGETISAAARRVGRARSTVRDRVESAYAAVPSAREYLPPADATPVDLTAVVAEFLATDTVTDLDAAVGVFLPGPSRRRGMTT